MLRDGGVQGMFSSYICASRLCSPSSKEAEVAVAHQQLKTLVAASQHQLHFMCTEHRRWALPVLQQGKNALSLPADICDSG